MAKKGFNYYKAETDRFQDIKIKRLKKKYHCTGYAVYQFVLNEVYRVRGYYVKFTEDHLFDVSEYWEIEEELVTEIIGYCAEIGLFNAQLWKECSVVTSRSIQERYLDICKMCKKTPAIDEEYRLVPAEVAAPAAPPLPSLFPEEGRATMRIVPGKAAQAATPTAQAAPPPSEEAPPETAVQGVAAQVLAQLEASEAKAVSEGFQKLPETSGNLPEECDKSIKSYRSKTNSSSNSPSEAEDKASLSSEKERLRLLLKTMSIAADDARWIGTIERIEAADSPLWVLAEEVKKSGGRLTVCSYLMPSLRSLVAAGRLKVRQQAVDTSEELRQMLRQAKVPSYDVEKILAAAQGQERVLREAIEEVRRSKGKITMPARYLLSKLRKAAPAKAS